VRTQAMLVESWGRMTSRTLELPPPGPGTVLVAVKYAGVGFADVMAVRGGYPLAPRRPFSPGYEFLGTVAALGSEVAGLEVGQRVVGMLPTMGAYRSVLAVDARWAVPVPPGLSDEVAAVLPLNSLTAWALLTKAARLSSGQSVLVHGAAGGVGTALLELARGLGVKVYGTASGERLEVVRALGGVPLDRKAGDWPARLAALEPKGVDAAFDAFGGASLEASWRALGPQGTLVSYGFSPSIDGGLGPMVRGLASIAAKKVFGGRRRATVLGVPGLIRDEPGWYREALTHLLELAARGALKPALHRVFPGSAAAEAHALLAQGVVQGKLLLESGAASTS
jgi:NADPH:quinone reductase-like Zn-dependent oxidoreductase